LKLLSKGPPREGKVKEKKKREHPDIPEDFTSTGEGAYLPQKKKDCTGKENAIANFLTMQPFSLEKGNTPTGRKVTFHTWEGGKNKGKKRTSRVRPILPGSSFACRGIPRKKGFLQKGRTPIRDGKM